MNTPDDPVKLFSVDQLSVRIYTDQLQMSQAVALDIQNYLQATLAVQASISAVLATGNSQIHFLSELARNKDLNWSSITFFHMDEYLGISPDHPASFRRYLRERVEEKIHPKTFHYIEGDAQEPLDECNRYAKLLRSNEIDLCCLGIGENGHIAFNDPPVANFEDPYLVKIVKLDHACQLQQVNEGHFPNLGAVPDYALTLTIPALCLARKMCCIVPEKRKAKAVKRALNGPIDVSCPASALRRCPQATLFLDADSASEL